MTEKMLIKSEKVSAKTIWVSALKIILCFWPFIALIITSVGSSQYNSSDPYVKLHNHSKAAHIMSNDNWGLIPLFIGIVVGATFLVWLISKNQIIVSDKRISGKSAFGKQIDLPIDSVSSVSTIKFIKGLSVSTASGNVSFWAIPNRAQIYEAISGLIIARQNQGADVRSINADYIDELTKIKQLLDTGVITQEEFDAKKRQLLDL